MVSLSLFCSLFCRMILSKKPATFWNHALGSFISHDLFAKPVSTFADHALERFPITWNHVIEKESLRFKELEHVLIEKVEQLFRIML